MKLLYKVLFVTFFTSLSFAQSLDGVKICIDPGHGGHEGDDRHIEEADFWESEGNFYKALHLKEILDSLGATVILTRYGNGDSGADDPGLSVRAGIANANDVDLFQSIHSNAYNGTRNFTLMLYHGYDNTPTFADAKSYALKAYQNFEKVNHVEDLSWDNIRGDFSFYGNTSGLGVLRPLTMPGILSEGSFHDYLPEAWRLKNSEYLRHEAWAITRAMLEHFDGGTYSTGNIAGILRDPLVNVPSSYKPRADLGDAKKPLNNVRAVIQPGNLEYNGDDQNNGYFLFEDLTPGDYTVYLEAEDYALDSATVTVTANNSSFIYKNLSLVPNENHPTITLTKPYNGEVEASNAGYIEINFDIRMDEAITESAFSITPAVSGDFTWENNQKTLIFKSNGNLTPGETYAISVDTTAKTIFDKNLQSEYSFNFTTRSKLNLVSNYPADREINISKSVQVRLQFDHAINGATLGGGTIQFLDSEGNFVNLIVENSLYAKGMIAFTPRDSLETGELYRVVLGEGIGDTEGVTFQQNIELSFVAENYVISTGNLVDDFEINNYWEDPFENPNSIGINESSGFRIVTNVKKNGSSSAELQYSFNELSGYYKVSKSIPASIGESSNVEFGIWIKGDLSNNILEYWFADAQSNLHSVEVDTLNFTGWKMKSINLADVSTDVLTFEGIGIKRNSPTDSTGVIYIDDAQYNFTTPVEEVKSNIPTEYSLEQNYPNPFNPSTKINFNIPKNSNVKLEIFNIIGEKIVTLISNKEYQPGSYSVDWDGKNQFGKQVPSGVYLYKISAGQFSSVKKMMMIK